MRAGKLAGVQLILNNWFLALLILFAFAGLGGKAIGVFAAVLWHEAAHAAAATVLGFRVREIELLPFGGVARIDGLTEAGAACEIIMAAAGPLASLVLAAVLYCAGSYFPVWAGQLDFYLKTNLTLALFNLLPALPLDGGRILRALLSVRVDYSQATTTLAGIGRVLAGGLALLTALDFWQTGTINLTFLFVAVFLWVAARSETAVAGFRVMRLMAGRKAELTARGVMPTAHFTAPAATPARNIVRLFGPDHYHFILVVDEQCHLRGTLSETEIWDELPNRGLYTRIGDFL